MDYLFRASGWVKWCFRLWVERGCLDEEKRGRNVDSFLHMFYSCPTRELLDSNLAWLQMNAWYSVYSHALKWTRLKNIPDAFKHLNYLHNLQWHRSHFYIVQDNRKSLLESYEPFKISSDHHPSDHMCIPPSDDYGADVTPGCLCTSLSHLCALGQECVT